MVFTTPSITDAPLRGSSPGYSRGRPLGLVGAARRAAGLRRLRRPRHAEALLQTAADDLRRLDVGAGVVPRAADLRVAFAVVLDDDAIVGHPLVVSLGRAIPTAAPPLSPLPILPFMLNAGHYNPHNNQPVRRTFLGLRQKVPGTAAAGASHFLECVAPSWGLRQKVPGTQESARHCGGRCVALSGVRRTFLGGLRQKVPGTQESARHCGRWCVALSWGVGQESARHSRKCQALRQVMRRTFLGGWARKCQALKKVPGTVAGGASHFLECVAPSWGGCARKCQALRKVPGTVAGGASHFLECVAPSWGLGKKVPGTGG